MEIIFIIIILVCSFLIMYLIENQIYSEQKFNKKIKAFEFLILELNSILETQNQKVKLSEDLRVRLEELNCRLSTKIIDLNQEMFQEMFPNKKRNS